MKPGPTIANLPALAAAVFLLAFMVGDLFFPQYFCEEFHLYPSDSPPSWLERVSLSPKTGRDEADDTIRIAAQRIGPASADGEDYCLHYVARPTIATDTIESINAPAVVSGPVLPPLPILRGPYHPPRSV